MSTAPRPLGRRSGAVVSATDSEVGALQPEANVAIVGLSTVLGVV